MQVAEAGKVLGSGGGELQPAAEAVQELQGLVNAIMRKSVVSGSEKKRLMDKVRTLCCAVCCALLCCASSMLRWVL